MVVGAGLAPALCRATTNGAPARVAPTKKRNLQMDTPKYNPKIHHRRSVRLKGYDYSQAGLYFVTICCQEMICRFGKIINGEMLFNELGAIVYNEWLKLPQRFQNFELDVFQIMPNHIHGIVALVGAPLVGAQNDAGCAMGSGGHKEGRGKPCPYGDGWRYYGRL